MDFPKSVPSVGLVDGKFVDEDVVAGTPGSLIPAQWGNAVTKEVLNVIESAGLTPDEDNNAQLLAALNAKIAAAIPVSPPDASTTVKGLVELATDPETQTGTDTQRAITPANLSSRTATETRTGILKLATQPLVNAGIDDLTAVTPKKLAEATRTQASMAFTTAGTGAAYLMSPVPAVTALAPNQRYTVLFHANSTVTPTINISSLGAKRLKQYTSAGAKVDAVLIAGQISDVIYDGTDLVVMHPLPDTSIGDVWAAQPIGAVIPMLDNGTVQAPPRNNPSYKYIRLTASDSYNAGILVSESVSGTAPLVIATGVVSLVGSPFNGVTVNLINTERRVLRAGLTGVVEQDAAQGHYHNVIAGNTSGTGLTSGTVTGGTGLVNDTVPGGGKVSGMASDGANGTVRVANETRVKSIGVTYYMRVI